LLASTDTNIKAPSSNKMVLGIRILI